MRWLTGFVLAEGEDRVSGHSGQFVVGADQVIVVTDSRYTIQARRETSEAHVDEVGVRPARCLAPAARLGRRATGRGRGRLDHPRALAAPRGRRAGRGARAGRRLGRGPPRREAARRDRADRGRLCRRRPRPRHAAARDPGRRHGGRPRAAPRVADPQRRRGGARVRRRLSLGAGGRPPARLAGRSTGAPRRGAAVRLRRPGRGLPQRHDPHAVRRRADRTRPGRLRPGRRAQQAAIDWIERAVAGGRLCRRAVASRTRSPGP